MSQATVETQTSLTSMYIVSQEEVPQEEQNMMEEFYGGKRCIILGTLENVHWAHMLGAVLEGSDERVCQFDNLITTN